ncbi:Acid phosphatase [Magnetospirillum sp. LM-5]|uniref:alkaline phosphatase family protein n=1 Tax=Magnetospirillum sp. LM-5 TaxID=2681466 RepID=UPI00137F6E60|nr:alkaline phosphatase family protein [Magnetospirillum sp. LM-5]CAA7612884.1 Acid phosphatase [Magnetospirillum sp. LM-5]
MKSVITLAIALACWAMPALAKEVRPIPAGLDRIEHIVVIYLENRSFDNMYGLFPGAAGLGDAWRAPAQRDAVTGKELDELPRVVDPRKKAPDLRFPAGLPNKPWLIDQYISHGDKFPDLVHEFYTHQRQINGGGNDLFASLSDAKALSMAYHDTRDTRLWRLASQYTLADNFFQAAFGGSFLNHMWLACACTPVFPDAPDSNRIHLDDKGNVTRRGNVTSDGFAVNTIQPVGGPFAPGADPATLLPVQNAPTIGDRLSEKGISWAWYSGGWDDAERGQAQSDFQYHHQPYAYFAPYQRGHAARDQHIRDDSRLGADIANKALPQVLFVKPRGRDNQHPGYANLADADRYAAELVERIQASPYWDKSVIIITYDEFGGLYDHVAPPKGDRWGPGSRIPALVISPFAKKGFVDHTQYDTTSVLKTIEARFKLEPLGSRDKAAQPMFNALDLGR